MPGVKLAAIDLGSNSFHAVVVEVLASGGFRVIDREKEMVRLGSRTLASGRLSTAAMKRGLEVLRKYRRLLESNPWTRSWPWRRPPSARRGTARTSSGAWAARPESGRAWPRGSRGPAHLPRRAPQGPPRGAGPRGRRGGRWQRRARPGRGGERRAHRLRETGRAADERALRALRPDLAEGGGAPRRPRPGDAGPGTCGAARRRLRAPRRHVGHDPLPGGHGPRARGPASNRHPASRHRGPRGDPGGATPPGGVRS